MYPASTVYGYACIYCTSLYISLQEAKRIAAGGTVQAATGKGGKKTKKKSSSATPKESDDIDVLLAEAVKENSTCFFTRYVHS